MQRKEARIQTSEMHKADGEVLYMLHESVQKH